MKLALPAILWLLCACTLAAQEVQRHGLVFEHWIADTFFGGHRPGYTDKWDIPGNLNPDRDGIPVNPKATREGTSVDMGDALRQFDIDEPFWFVIGYWEQRGPEKFMVRILAERMPAELWRSFWHPIQREDLEKLDAVIKDRSLDYREARKQAHAIKNAPPFSEAIMVVNPKIDSRGQRRLQCSLRYKDLVARLLGGREPARSDSPSLWGEIFPNPIASLPRSFEKNTGNNP
jgi:hypothetical protein